MRNEALDTFLWGAQVPNIPAETSLKNSLTQSGAPPSHILVIPLLSTGYLGDSINVYSVQCKQGDILCTLYTVQCTHLCAGTHYTVGGFEISGLRILLLRASLMLGPSGVSHPSLWGLAHVLHHATCQLAHMNHQGPLQSAPTCLHTLHTWLLPMRHVSYHTTSK